MKQNTLKDTPVAIVSMGGIYPGARNLDEFWDNVKNGVDSSSIVPDERWVKPATEALGGLAPEKDKVRSDRGYFVRDWRYEGPTGPYTQETLDAFDPSVHLTLKAGYEAFQKARLNGIDKSRISVILGNLLLPTDLSSKVTSEVILNTMEEAIFGACKDTLTQRPENLHVGNLPTQVLADILGVEGGSYSLDAACASSLYALRYACDELLSLKKDAVLAGGVSRPDSLYTQMGFSQLKALSPKGKSHPFDSRGEGLLVGEGAGIFVLKRLEDAKRDGDDILGIIRGIGLSNDGSGSLLSPETSGQLRAMRAAYDEAGWTPEELSMIECHATGTPIGDKIEFQSLIELWKGYKRQGSKCALGSVKSNIGHLLTAAGASGLTKILLSLRHKTIPPIANFVSPGTGVTIEDSPFTIFKEATQWPDENGPRKAAISGFGFGGINAHVLIEEYRPSQSYSIGEKSIGSKQQVALIAMVKDESDDILRADELDNTAANPFATNWIQSYLQTDLVRFSPIKVLQPTLGEFRIPPSEFSEMLPQQLQMLITADKALKETRITKERNNRAGVYVGVKLDAKTNEFCSRWQLDNTFRSWEEKHGKTLSGDEKEKFLDGLKDVASPALNTNRTMGALGGLVASRIAREYTFGGASLTFTNEENSGLRALEIAKHEIEIGNLDLAVVGACDFTTTSSFAVAHSISQPKPIVYKDSAVAFVLKNLEKAKDDGDRIIAVLDEMDFVHNKTNMRSASCSYRAHGKEIDSWHGSREVYYGASAALVHFYDHVKAVENSNILSTSGKSFWPCDQGTDQHIRLISDSLDHNRSHVSVRKYANPHVNFTRDLILLSAPSPSLLRSRIENALSTVAENQCDLLVASLISGNENRDSVRLAVQFDNLNDLRNTLKLISTELHDGISTDFFKVHPLKNKVSLGLSPKIPGKIAFLYPGVGQAYPNMGKELMSHFSAQYQGGDQNCEGALSHFCPEEVWKDKVDYSKLNSHMGMAAQTSFGDLTTRLLRGAGIQPDVAIGYSLGESSAMIALDLWEDRAEMFRRLKESSVFTSDLTGEQNALRQLWDLPAHAETNWEAATLRGDFGKIESLLAKYSKLYLMAVNSPQEVVIGGDQAELKSLVAETRCQIFPLQGIATLHCPAVKFIKKRFKDFHHLPLRPQENIDFYSCASGEVIEQNSDAVANSVYDHALNGVRFQRVIEKAYQEGVRYFIEVGPGSSLTRLVRENLVGLDHISFTINSNPTEEHKSLLKGLALAWTHGLSLEEEFIYSKRVLGLRKKQSVQIENRQRYGESWSKMPANMDELTWTEPLEQRKIEGASSVDRPLVASNKMQNVSDSNVIKKHQRVASPSLVSLVGENMSRINEEISHGQNLFMDLQLKTAKTIELLTRGNGDLPHRAIQGEMKITEPSFQGASTRAPDKSAPVIDVKQDFFPHPPFSNVKPWLDYRQCQEIASGKIGNVLGEMFAEADTYHTRVRLPEGPLLLCHRIMKVEAEPRSMTHGQLVTEHDIFHDAWYLDHGRIPTCVAVEAGQADLFLSGYLGIDFLVKGNAVYRLLDAEVTFHDDLPEVGKTIRYEIKLLHFFNQGSTRLFRFEFEATVDGKPLISMKKGCAGFFSQKELDAGKGIVKTTLDLKEMPGKITGGFQWLAKPDVIQIPDTKLDALRQGDYVTAFGSGFEGLRLTNPGGIPGDMMRLVHRVQSIDPTGGRFGIGEIVGEADIDPNDWFLTCHFMDDMVMPGTLMYECCMHTLRILLMNMGWVGEDEDMLCQPIKGVASKLVCRGQVLQSTKKVTYRIVIKEIGYGPKPYAIVDAMMYADGKPIVDILNMSAEYPNLSKEKLESLWAGKLQAPTENVSVVSSLPEYEVKSAYYTKEQIVAYAEGNPSEGFGEPYKIFDRERRLARLPRDPYLFVDRITELGAEAWKLTPNRMIEAQYDVPPDAWYFEADGQGVMPFAVLLEIALQPCGWFAAFMGSALTSEKDLHFRNLGGEATQFVPVLPDIGTLTTTVTVTKISQSGGMIIQDFNLHVRSKDQVVYEGKTTFGFFTTEALATQIGIRNAGNSYKNWTEDLVQDQSTVSYPEGKLLPIDPIKMVDSIETYEKKGGSKGLGYIRGFKRVVPDEWFFHAHFYQDPVMPGSLGLEAFLQLLRHVVFEEFGVSDANFALAPSLENTHQWIYRGQVVQKNKVIRVEADIVDVDHRNKTITANGYLMVDGLPIYEMRNFQVTVS